MKRSPLPRRKTRLPRRKKYIERYKRPNARRPTPRKEVLARINEPYRQFIRRQPCILQSSHRPHRCTWSPDLPAPAPGEFARACHYRVRKHGDRRNLYPGCDGAHTGSLGEYTMGKKSFQEYWGVDIPATRDRLWDEYLELAA